jgi:tetratricopeptide (TPR) repeat protein
MDTLQAKRDRRKHRRFVGRQNEIERFRDLVRDESLANNVLMIWGVGGVGKSTILRKFADIAREGEVPWALATLESVRSASEIMYAWREDFSEEEFKSFDQELLRIAQIESKIRQAAGSLANGTFRAIEAAGPIGAFAVGALGEERMKSWLGTILTKPEMDSYLSSQKNLTRRFAEGLNALAAKTRLVLFLDTYEAASSSIDGWLRQLLESEISVNVLFVVAGRDRLEDMSLEWSEWMTIVEEVELKEFSSPEAEKYLELWGISDRHLASRIMDFTGNLPWALEMTMESLESIDDAQDISVASPEMRRIEHKVVSRFLRQIGEETDLQRLVETCSVLRFFNQDILEHILCTDVSTQLRAIRQYSFVRIREDGQYMLHDVVREFIETELEARSPVKWRQINKKAAAFYANLVEQEQGYENGRLAHTVELVRHTCAVDEHEALKILESRCTRLFGPMLEAYCVPIIEVLQEQIRKKRIKGELNRVKVEYFLGQIQLVQGRFSAARDRFYAAIRSPMATGDIKLGAYAALCDILHRQGDVNTALEVALAGLALAEELQDPESVSLLATRVGEMYGVLGDLRMSEVYCVKSEECLTQVEDAFTAGQVHLLLAHVYVWRGAYDSGERNLQRALEHWSAIGNDYGIAQVHSSLGWLCALIGRCEEGLKYCTRAYSFFEETIDPYYMGLVALNIAEFYRMREDILKAVSWNKRAIERMREVGSLLYEGIATYQLGQAYYDSGQYNEAITVLEHALGLESEQIGELYSIGITLMYLGLSYDAIGSSEIANTYLDRSEKALSSAQNPHGLALLSVFLAQRALDLDLLDTFEDQVERAEMIAEDRQYFDVLARVLYLRGVRRIIEYSAMGNGERDAAIFEDAAEIFCQALSTAIEYNRYLLDGILDKVVKAVRHHLPSPRFSDESRQLSEAIVSYWSTRTTEAGRRIEEVERENRTLEVGDGKPQQMLVEQVEEFGLQ